MDEGMHTDIAIVILAAGLGKRMKSDRAKVLHEVCGRPMVLYVMETARKIAGNRVVVVVGHQAESVRKVVSRGYDAAFAIQDRQLGTGHAVACALDHLPPGTQEVLILYGDVPLLEPATLECFLDNHLSDARDLSILSVESEDPTGYGRLVTGPRGEVLAIVEEADADAEQKKIRLVNTGIFCVRADFLSDALGQLEADNAQGELYLTDIVGIGYRRGCKIGLFVHDDVEEVAGVNTLAELVAVESSMRRRPGFKS